MHTLRNYKGEIISGIKTLSQSKFGSGLTYPNGDPMVNWGLLSEFADDDGFDTRNIEKNKHYKIRMRLKKGIIIIRYGSETGRFTAPKGTKFDELSLPYSIDSLEYNEYKVVSSIKVACIVEKGIVAPGFERVGGGIQFLHNKTIIELLKNGSIERMYNGK